MDADRRHWHSKPYTITAIQNQNSWSYNHLRELLRTTSSEAD